MPTVVQDPAVKEHATATRVKDATPISEGTIDDVSGRRPVVYSLATIQAMADKHIDQIESAPLAATNSATEYYCVTSDTFYRLTAFARDEYDHTHIDIERLQTVVDVHTTQYLADLHDYTGDFDSHSRTLCNALNDQTPSEGAVTHDTEPDNAHYGFVDTRGLVVDRGTHTDP